MKASLLRLAAMAALAIPAQAAVAQGITERLDDRSYFTDGKDAWDKTCARCHTVIDDRMDQSVGPDLSVNEYDYDTLRHFVRNGHLAMPSFPESAISDKTLAELADYVAKNIYKGDTK